MQTTNYAIQNKNSEQNSMQSKWNNFSFDFDLYSFSPFGKCSFCCFNLMVSAGFSQSREVAVRLMKRVSLRN